MTKVWSITAAGHGIGCAMARTVLKSAGKVVAAGANIELVHTSLKDVAGEHLQWSASTAVMSQGRKTRYVMR